VRGKLVVPGLVDIHTHCGRSADGPGVVLRGAISTDILHFPA
jgi:imidazolonepropionase-like amidohydrolase